MNAFEDGVIVAENIMGYRYPRKWSSRKLGFLRKVFLALISQKYVHLEVLVRFVWVG